MTRQVLITFSLVFLSVCGWGQSIPYITLKTLEDCAKELRQIDGVTAELKLEHSDPVDVRSFRLALESPDGRTNIIKVHKDGTFRLPELAADDQERSRVTHSLERGALTLSFSCFWNGELPGELKTQEASLFTLCSAAAEQFDKIEPAFVKLGDAIPDFKDFQMTIVGVSLPREKPSSGFALLKNGDRTVATIDLSQTGKASWMFDDYDPKTHRVVWDMKKGEPEPKLLMEIKSGKEAAALKRAILVRKVK
jgi:hypothetical protein